MNVKKPTKRRSRKVSAGLWERPKNPAIKPMKHMVTIGNKRYEYFITPIDRKWVFFECPGGGIAQRFLAEDIMALLIDLPELILAEIEYSKKQEEVIRFRVSSENKKEIQKRAIKAGFPTISAFLRNLALGV